MGQSPLLPPLPLPHPQATTAPILSPPPPPPRSLSPWYN